MLKIERAIAFTLPDGSYIKVEAQPEPGEKGLRQGRTTGAHLM